jgi:hypothetical protein
VGRDRLTVKPSAKPTLVRTQHLPPPAETARELGIPGLAGLLCLVPLWFMMCRCEPPRSSGYGHMGGRIRARASGSPHRLLQDFDGPLAAVKSLPGSQKVTDDRGSGLRMAHGIHGQSREPCGCPGVSRWPDRAVCVPKTSSTALTSRVASPAVRL